MKNIIRTKKGFTLVELVIVIVIVGILSVISVPIYRGYVEKAMVTEGKVLLSAIAKAELAYQVEHGYFLNAYGYDEYVSALDIDLRGNKYFKEFYAQSGSGSSYVVDAMVAPSSVEKSFYDDNNDNVEIWVYGWNNNTSWTLHATQWASGGLRGNDDDIDVWRNSGGMLR